MANFGNNIYSCINHMCNMDLDFCFRCKDFRNLTLKKEDTYRYFQLSNGKCIKVLSNIVGQSKALLYKPYDEKLKLAKEIMEGGYVIKQCNIEMFDNAYEYQATILHNNIVYKLSYSYSYDEFDNNNKSEKLESLSLVWHDNIEKL